MGKVNKAKSLDQFVGDGLINSMEERELQDFDRNIHERLAYHIKHYSVSFTLPPKEEFKNNAYGLTLWLDSDSRLCMELSVNEPLFLLSQADSLDISQNLRLVLETSDYDCGNGVPFTDGVAILPKEEYEKLLKLNNPIMAKLQYYDKIKEQKELISCMRELLKPFRGPTKLM